MPLPVPLAPLPAWLQVLSPALVHQSAVLVYPWASRDRQLAFARAEEVLTPVAVWLVPPLPLSLVRCWEGNQVFLFSRTREEDRW